MAADLRFFRSAAFRVPWSQAADRNGGGLRYRLEKYTLA